jgi:hypothetical protein
LGLDIEGRDIRVKRFAEIVMAKADQLALLIGNL